MIHRLVRIAGTVARWFRFTWQVRRLSSHPSIVIWDGCNECTVAGRWSAESGVSNYGELLNGISYGIESWLKLLITGEPLFLHSLSFFRSDDFVDCRPMDRFWWVPKQRSMPPLWWPWWQKKMTPAQSGHRVLLLGGQQDLQTHGWAACLLHLLTPYHRFITSVSVTCSFFGCFVFFDTFPATQIPWFVLPDTVEEGPTVDPIPVMK